MRRSGAFITCLLILLNCICIGCANPRVILPAEIRGKEEEREKKNAKDSLSDKYNNFNLVGVDHFGRSFDVISGLKTDRQVGIFYWPWIGQPYASDIYDASKILALPNGLKLLTEFNHHDPDISPNGQAHYWGEPLWGYYNSEDEWVIRKQMQMLTMAGIDFIFFDTTNALIYADVFLKVCAVIDEMLKEGWNAPKVVFYTHSHSFQTVRTLYKELYKPHRFPDTWYRVNGKPLIIAYIEPEDDLREAASRNDTGYKPGVLSDEILKFFHFMKPQWPSDPVYPDGFPWVEWTFPQPLHTESGVMNVTVASHPMVPMSFSLTRPDWVNWGRGWDPSTRLNRVSDVERGTFFQLQWDHAIATDPPMISVGGWNEWIAYKQPYDGEYMLCDAANREYSRDIEPMAGGYQDAFYLQLIANIRRYKGIIEKQPEPNTPKKIDIQGSLTQWNDVKYIVRNTDHKFIARDAFGGSNTVHYFQAAPVNKLTEIRVAHDREHIYFYLKGKDTFNDYDGTGNWLNVFVGTGKPSRKGWEGYEYVIGRKVENDEVSIEKLEEGFKTSLVAKGKFFKTGDVIQLSIPRSAIGLDNCLEFYFKGAMGVANYMDIMDYYRSGSAMPMGRLSYMYQLN